MNDIAARPHVHHTRAPRPIARNQLPFIATGPRVTGRWNSGRSSICPSRSGCAQSGRRLIRSNPRSVGNRAQAESTKVSVSCNELSVDNVAYDKVTAIPSRRDLNVAIGGRIVQLDLQPIGCSHQPRQIRTEDLEPELPQIIAGGSPNGNGVVKVRLRIQIGEEA